MIQYVDWWMWIQVTDKYTDLEKDEVNIVTGALVLKQKTGPSVCPFVCEFIVRVLFKGFFVQFITFNIIIFGKR